MKVWVVSAVALLALTACARQDPLEVTDAWMRETVGGSTNAAMFMTIRSDAGDRLIAASSNAARKTDLMTMTHGSGTMQMEYVKGIDIPADTPVSLNPAGFHVWLEGLKRPLRASEKVSVTLKFEGGGERSVAAQVIGATGQPPGS